MQTVTIGFKYEDGKREKAAKIIRTVKAVLPDNEVLDANGELWQVERVGNNFKAVA